MELPASVARAIDAVNAGDKLIGARTRFDVTGSEPIDGGVAVDIEVTSDGFNGYSRFAFVTDGDALRSMAITA